MRLGTLYFASLHAFGANISFAHFTFSILDGDALDVGLKPTIAYAVRVAYAASSHRMLAAYFTYF